MFYSEETMHKINKDKGSFNVTYQLPIMYYSLIISALLKFLINNLGLYEEDILTFKNNKNLYILFYFCNKLFSKCNVLFR